MNRNHPIYRLTTKQAEVAATFGIRPPYEVDEMFPTGDIFPTGKKTPFYNAVIVQDGHNRRIERMEWGVPTQVPSKRDSATKLTKYVTNVRNLSSNFWRSMLTTPARRCLVPVTSFSEYGLAPGEEGKKPLHWFDVPSRPIVAFAGIWRPTERGNAYGFLTTEPNSVVAPLAPLRDRLRVDPQLAARRRERSLRSLYCCSDGVRRRRAPVTNLSHAASFHSNEKDRTIKLWDQTPREVARFV